MNSAPIKAVFFDIDGTLYRKETSTLPASIAPAFRALQEKGIKVAIATGRSECALPQAVNELIDEVGVDLLVTTNGQYVSHQGKRLIDHPIALDTIERLLPVFEQYGLMYGFVSNERLVTNADHDVVANALRHIGEYDVDPDYYQDNVVHQILLFSPDNNFDLAMADEPGLQGFKLVPWRKNSVDLLPVEASKMRGIEAAMQALGITKDNVMAFGDGLNDLEMIEFAGVGVAMRDGHEDLIAVADIIAEPLEDDGIAKALADYGLID